MRCRPPAGGPPTSRVHYRARSHRPARDRAARQGWKSRYPATAAGGGKLGPGIEDAADHQGQDEVAAAVAVRAEQPIEADLARGAEGRVDMTMRQRADDGNGILVLGNNGAAFEQGLEGADQLVRQVGEVHQRALLDLARLAVALAQQDGRGRVAIGDGFDIHGNIIAIAPRSSNQNPPYYMATFRCPSKQIRLRYQYLDGTERGKLRLSIG